MVSRYGQGSVRYNVVAYLILLTVMRGNKDSFKGTFKSAGLYKNTNSLPKPNLSNTHGGGSRAAKNANAKSTVDGTTLVTVS